MRIRDLAKEEGQLLSSKVSDVAKRSRESNVQPALAFYAQICILPHSRDSFSLIFDTYFNT